MDIIGNIKRYMTALLLLGINLSLTACGSMTSPVDQAYYTGGSAFSLPGGYTRTIFSSNNF